MKKSLTLAAFAASMILLAGCQTQEPKAAAEPAGQAAYEEALASAKSAQKAAAAAKNEWRDTGKMIKSAVKKAGAGDYAGATKLLKTAEMQGKDAVAQAMQQEGAGNPGYLY